MSTWPEIVNAVMPKFNEIAMQHKLVRWQEESQFAIQALQKNEQLASCLDWTVQNAIINVAAVGLTLNPADGFAYLVPEYNKQLKALECQLRISFKGLLKVANDSGAIQWAKAEIVKEADQFEYKGPAEKPDHSMNPFSDRGNPIGVYCIAKTCEGDFLVDVMPWTEVMKIKDKAKTQTVWDTWPEEMAKKAIIKRAFKQWPKKKDSRLSQAVYVLNEHEGSAEIIDADTIEDNARRDELLNKFVTAINEQNGLALIAMERNMSEQMQYSIFRKLNNKQKAAYREISQQGAATIDQYLEIVRENISGEDELGLREHWDELGEIGVRLLWQHLKQEEQNTVRALLEKTAA